ncbi:hypothetical protein TD95_004117 [Thielaviopsis punctulata]|uniref:EF-hand domain-containing protein n=1 Tax=Thielaviopsis punctulata TaxID=72032 RepID=A0A0F4ZLL7_9PEZI|nr:hypothetical protein TD95_004117 [Thielaviopsis punctulata]
MASPFKPSPLGLGTSSSSTPTRNSPFRRPESPSVSTAAPLRPAFVTPSTSPTKQPQSSISPTKLPQSSSGLPTGISPRVLNSPFHAAAASASASAPDTDALPAARPRSSHKTSGSPFVSPSGKTTPASPGSPSPAPRQLRASPFAGYSAASTSSKMTMMIGGSVSNANALSQLQPAQVRTLREGFQILDRDSDGFVNREDVADMLNQLGLPSTASDIAAFFPPSSPQTMSMAIFINTLASALAALSPSSELLSAFSAFDDDDSGQIDLAELKDALLNTVPEAGEKPLTEAEIDQVMNGFTARRAFSKKSMSMSIGMGMVGGGGGGAGGHGLAGLAKRGDVFKYQDFVNNIMSSGQSASERKEEAEE